MGAPNPVRTLESHAVVENRKGDEGCVSDSGEHYMRSIRTGADKVVYVEQCATCLWIDPASLDWWADNAIKTALSARAQRIAIATETEPFAFVQQQGEALTLIEIVYQALGAASVCWEHKDLLAAGMFDSTRAKAIGDALMAEIHRAQSHDSNAKEPNPVG